MDAETLFKIEISGIQNIKEGPELSVEIYMVNS